MNFRAESRISNALDESGLKTGAPECCQTLADLLSEVRS
jgi:hypothetical protein